MKSLMEIFLGKRCNGGDMEKGRGEYNQSTAIVSATDERHTGDLRVTFERPLGDLWATFGRPLEFYASSVRDCRDSRRAFTPIKIIPFIFLGALHRFMGKVALLVVLLMMFGVGEVWGTDQTYTVTTPTSGRNTSNNILISCVTSSQKVANTSVNVFYLSTASYPLAVFSKAVNIKQIYIEGCYNSGNANQNNCFTVFTSTNGTTFTTPASGFSVTKNDNGTVTNPTSLSNMQMIGNNQSYSTQITITFSSPIMALYLNRVGNTNIKTITVTYDDAITALPQLCEAHTTGTTTVSGTGATITSASLSSGTTIGDLNYVKIGKTSDLSSKYIKLTLGDSKKFAEGDEIWVECTAGNKANTATGISLNSSNSSTGAKEQHPAVGLATGAPVWIRRVTAADDPWVNSSDLYLGGYSTDDRIYNIEVRRAAASCSAPAAPTISGTEEYNANGTITLTATCESGADGSTTYTWYKGSDFATAKAAGAVQAAATGSAGYTFTKTAVVADAGTYWCEASNGSGCEAHNSTGKAITVSCLTAPVAVTSLTCSAQTGASLTYTWTKASNASGYTASLWDNSSCTGDAVATQELGDVATVTFSTLSSSSTYYCKVQSKGNGTVYCADGGTTSAVSGTTSAVCAATIPGNISKGDASGGTGTITLTAAGSQESGDTWYWQSAEDGTATNLGSGATKNVSAAGTYYIRSYNTAGDCWSDAKSVTVSAADLLTPINPTLSYASSVLVDNTINPTLTGNTGSGTVTYTLNSVSPSGSLTINSSTGAVTGVTVGGTATVTATIAASGNYTGGSATSGTITVSAGPTGTSTITYNLDVTNNGTTLQTLTTPIDLPRTTLSASPSSSLLAGGLGTGGSHSGDKNKHNGTRTLGINTLSEETASKYFYVTFTVADGYQFTPSAISLKVLTIGGNATSYKATLTDGVNSITGTASATNDSELTIGSWDGLSSTALTGTVTLKLWAWYTTSGTYNAYRLSTPITITGTVEEVPSCDANPANPDGLAAGSITATGVTFTITDDESPNSYDIYYSTSSTAPVAGTAATTTTNSKTKAVTGLTANTTYYAWVRAVCDGSHKSSWVALSGSTFTTLKAQPNLYTVGAAMEGVCNSKATAKITLSGSQSGVSYQLKNNGSNDGDAKAGTGSALEWTGKGSGVYTVWAVEGTYAARQMSRTVTVEKYDSTEITTEPSNINATASVPFVIGSDMVAAGHDLTYQWYSCNSTGEEMTELTDSTASTMRLTKTAGTYYYRVKVTGSCGTPNYDLSRVVTVTVVSAGSTYSITYNCNSAESGCPSNVAAATNLPNPLPSAPTKTGYTFGGWYTNEGLTDAAVAGASLEVNTTLYAKWCANHNVTWYVNGEEYTTGSPTTSTNECAGITTMPTAPSALTCSDSFRGWTATNLYGEAVNTPPSDLFTTTGGAPVIDGDKTFYAVFAETDAGDARTEEQKKETSFTSVFTSKAWADAGSLWTSGQDGSQLTSGQGVKVTTSVSGANATTKASYKGVKAVIVTYNTLADAGVGTIAIEVGGTAMTGSASVTKTGGTADRTISYTPSSADFLDGTVKITVTCTTNSIHIKSVQVIYSGYHNYRCQCPTLTLTGPTGDLVFITSAASKKVRSQEAFHVSGSNLTRGSGALTGDFGSSALNAKFAFKDANGDDVTTEADGSIDADLYVFYTPDAADTEDGLDVATAITVTVPGAGTATSNDLIASKAIKGRHLPANFVIAAKNGDNWYALPANMGQGDAATNRAPIAIEVDNTTTPTKGIISNITHTYSLIAVPSAVQSRDSGDYVILWMSGKNKPLYGNPSNAQVGSSTKSVINNLDRDYWWALTQTSASVSSAAAATYTISVANGNENNPLKIWKNAGGSGVPYWGLYSSASNIITELRLLPFEYAITLDKNGGSADGLASVAPNGTSATIISAPTYEGYEVDYYMTDDGFAEVLNPDGSFYSTSAVDGSGHEYITDGKWVDTSTPISLKAHWVADATYTVTYQYNGATGGASTPSATGLSVTLPTPTKTDYTFQGWYESSGTKAGDGGDTYNPAADITLYALWRADCAGGGTTTLVDINFKDATWSGKTFSQGNDNNEDLINDVYFWSKSSSYHFSLADNTTKGLTFPNSNMASGNSYFCIPITGINASDKQITVTLKHGYNSNKASFKYVYVDGRNSWIDGNTNSSGGTSVSDANNSDTQMSFTLSGSSTTKTYGHLIIGRGSSSYTNIYGVTVTTPNNATCYYVTYNGNGADGGFTKDEAAHGSGSDVTVLANSFTRTGYTFTGWNTEAGGGGTAYTAGGTISAISGNVTLHAQWSSGTKYEVTYNGNGATDGTAPVDASSPYAAGTNVTVLGNTGSLEKSNYTFDGWATANDGTGTSYAADGTISSIAADVLLYAKWKQTVTLKTGAQGTGADKEPTIYFNGATLNSFSAHSAAGYELQGYYTASSEGVKILNANGTFAGTDISAYITSSKWTRTGSTTLYAQWRASAGSTCYEWDAEETKPRTGTDENFGGLYLTATTKTKVSFYSGHTADSCYSVSKASQILTGHLNGTEIGSVKFKASSSDASNNTFMISFGSTVPFDTAHIIQVSSKDYVVKTVNKNDAAASEYTVTAPAGTKSFAMGRNGSAPHLTGDDLKNSGSRYLYYLYVCSAGGGTHTISYNNGGGSGSMSSHTSIADNGSQTLTANSFTAPTNYTFAGWVADVPVTIGGDTKAAGTLIADESTITNITTDIALTAKWSQTLTLETGSQGSDADEDLTVYYNSTSITGHTPHTAGGYRLVGYYTASSDGTKVLNADGTFASTAVDGYIADGKWTYTTASSLTLYGQWEASSLLKWNLKVNVSESPITTTSKESATVRILTENMTNLDSVGLNITASKRGSLTSVISTPSSYDGDKYMKVTFQVANGYKLVPTAINVKVQPKGSDKYAKLELVDNAGTPHSISYTTASKLKEGTIHTVTLSNGEDVEFTGTVTLKIYCYGATDGYRLGTPIEINGSVEEACTMPSYTGLDYEQTEYVKDAAASAISVTDPTDVTTYLWKSNTSNDRTGGSAASGTNNTASYTPLTTSTGTTYYWCELTNACGTVKTPAVAITVRADKTDPTVTWTDPASVNYGGGNYTLKATVNSGWDGTLDASMLTAPAGIRIYGATTGTDGSSRKYIEVKFDVQTSFDKTTYASNIPFTLSLPETTNYDAIDDEHDVSYEACSGAGAGTSYNIRVRKDVTKVDNNYYCWLSTDGWISPSPNNSISTSSIKKAESPVAPFDTIYDNNTQTIFVRTYHANINKVRIYAKFNANNMTVTNVYKHTTYYSPGSSNEIDADDYTVVYNNDESAEDLGTAAQGYVDITLNTALAANDIICVKFSASRVRPLGAVITEASGGSLTTSLTWSETADDDSNKKNKTTGDANFTISASKSGVNANTLGTISYASNHPEYASVNASTGEVTLVAAGTAQITATLAASGCYQKATKTYTIVVTDVACEEPSGSIELTEGSASKCPSEEVTLTMTGFTSGATVTWYRGATEITDATTLSDSISTSGSTSTLVTKTPAVYSAIAHSGCDAKRTNSITIANKSAEAGATKLVDEWYIKQGRLTPDIALFELTGAADGDDGWAMKTGAGADLSSIAGCSFERKGDIVYLHGYSTEGVGPTGIASAANETIKVVVSDACGGTTTSETIIIHKQVQTDKHVLAFVVTGTGKGGFTDGITAAQTTNVPLYNTLAENFDIQATNIYSTDDEKKIKEYYSQFDILCVTDYPNTQTKGVNSKSYVDALGSLIDIRPILTMEAFVSKLDNWKAKGISGEPKSPSERQYSMLLQCKDHEIFAGTTLTKIGEGDEAMFRINMVDKNIEDYPTLDANTPGTKAYNAGGKPALQGFTFTKDMASDLLPLGLIGDGAGNDLQVGIERQHEMEARLLVLGINSYAMERLTADGEQVVVNALKYLMKKNSEDISDCSVYFDNSAGDNDWTNPANWGPSYSAIPLSTQEARILAPCEVKDGDVVHVASIKIVPDGKYNHGSATANGKLTISEGGTLIVSGMIHSATAPLYYEKRNTAATDLVINTTPAKQGALIYNNENGGTRGTVNMYTKTSRINGKLQWQYVGLPFETATDQIYGGLYINKYSETQGTWIVMRYQGDRTINAWEGLGLAGDASGYACMQGALTSTANKEITLTYSAAAGENLIGNSWTAPIQITQMDAEDFGDAEPTVYIFNTGRYRKDGSEGTVDSEQGGYNASTGSAALTAGQWLTIPIAAAKTNVWEGMKVIPAYQGFEVNTTTEATLTLDYDKHVRPATNSTNEAMRAPMRRKIGVNGGVSGYRITVSDSTSRTDMYLFEGGIFTDEYDRGWDGNYLPCDGHSAQLYTQTTLGKLAVAALPDLEGTVLGFKPGKSAEYTFSFASDESGYFLNDLKMHESTLIQEGNTYTFNWENGDSTNRFIISASPYKMPTGVEEMENGKWKMENAKKVLIDDHLYIIRAGKMFNATGGRVK